MNDETLNWQGMGFLYTSQFCISYSHYLCLPQCLRELTQEIVCKHSLTFHLWTRANANGVKDHSYNNRNTHNNSRFFWRCNHNIIANIRVL